ncbi:MAG: S8 family serine peptidase, partial [Acidobacteriota bacterium]
SGAYKGIASNANVISLKALNNTGLGNTSWLLNALTWIQNNRTTYNIKVVNLSLGTNAIDTYTNDPICLKVKALANAGVVVVAAAGNLGKNYSTGQKIYGMIHSPGNSPYAITVGASNSLGTASQADDTMASYSSRGPTRSYYRTSTGTAVYDNLIKPDIVAPGNKLVSYKAPGNLMSTLSPTLNLTTEALAADVDKNMYMSGTSMSAPVVAGAAALLLQVNPNLTPNMIRMIMQYTAKPISGANTFEQGAGQLNIEGAVRLARSLRTDVDFQTLAKGTTMVPTGWVMPTTSTTIGGHTFPWSQHVIGKFTKISGANLVSQFQTVYKRENLLGDGITFASGNFSMNTTSHFTTGLTLNRYVTTSNGTALGAGTT